jgi:ribosomal protein S18 acetylase RimI-like enzyme
MPDVRHAASRRAIDADVARIAQLARRSRAELAEERGGPLWLVREARAEPLEDGLAADVANDDALVVVGTYDDVLVGYATATTEILRDGSLLARLSDIYVEPGARDIGVGEAMMDDVIAWSVARGCRGIDSLALPGMRASKNFFERYGLKARQLIVHRSFGPQDIAGDS